MISDYIVTKLFSANTACVASDERVGLRKTRLVATARHSEFLKPFYRVDRRFGNRDFRIQDGNLTGDEEVVKKQKTRIALAIAGIIVVAISDLSSTKFSSRKREPNRSTLRRA